MNKHIVHRTLIVLIGATLALVGAAAVAAKPAPPPPPPPTPTSCSGVPGVGVFPAMVYAKAKYKTIKRGGGTTVYDGSDMYLADSNGKCSILIASSPYLGGLSYRQIGTEARVVFLESSRIRLLKFNVVSGSVVQSLPLSSAIVYTPSWTPAGVSDVELSADGRTIYFTEEIETTDGRWFDTLYSISLDSCSSSCTPQTLFVFKEDSGVSGLSINSAGNRLYMSIHDRVPDFRTISFLQKDQNGIWASLRHVVSDRDGGYNIDVNGFAGTALGRWDYNGSSTLKDVLSYVVERSSGDTTDIIDVTNCAAATSVSQDSCLTAGESMVVKSGIAGYGTSFTSTPSSSTSGTPSLLVMSGGSVVDVGLGASAPVTLLSGGGADSAD